MILKVEKVPSRVLTSVAKPVKAFDGRLLKLISDMEDTLRAAHDPEGVGLAAPQVGVSLALFITRPDKRAKMRAYANPQIVKMEGESEQMKSGPKTTLEGCLSVDKIWSPLSRPQKVLLSYQAPDGKRHEEWFEGFKAVIVQHEVDHLNGILFTARAMEQHAKLFEERDGAFEEISI